VEHRILTNRRAALVRANDSDPTLADEAAQILAGLMAPQKHLSPKYFYDEIGSKLFDRICTLPEYYPTRTEREIMDEFLDEMSALAGPYVAVIEFGSGSSQKIRQLLDALDRPVAYVPVDISGQYLSGMANAVARDYPQLQVLPVYADFTQPFELPSYKKLPARNLIFFPGSTIGNFERDDARSLLEVMRVEAGSDGALLIGVDRKKDPAILQAAYNDAAGVTAAFNLNVLRRLNDELGADFDLNAFRHEAIYDEAGGRIEMRLVSCKAQRVEIAGHTLAFRAGEHIVTEYSHKYADDEFAALALSAGWQPVRQWQDPDALFGVHYLVVAS
jgi:dimethylhistidine N-methyltransferase